jgi:hypothetical protein
MTDPRNSRPGSTLITALSLWLIRWTALLGGFGLASLYLEMSWLWMIGVVGALGDLAITLLNEARLAERRNKARQLMSKIKEHTRDEDADENI